MALYNLLGVEILDADYSFSCSNFSRDDHAPAGGGEDGGGGDGGKAESPLFGYNRHGWLVLPQLAAYFGLRGKTSEAAGAKLGAVEGAAAAPRAWKDTNLGLLCQLVRLLVRAPAYVSGAGGVRGLSHVSLGEFLAAKGCVRAACCCWRTLSFKQQQQPKQQQQQQQQQYTEILRVLDVSWHLVPNQTWS